ncbi:MAG: hypothetical protein CMJ46_13485 [Planctomyces sp.]|nr:hypothetical protein [Planctomyces sp.]
MNLDSIIYHGGMITVLAVVPVVACMLFHGPATRFVFSQFTGSLLAWGYYLWQYFINPTLPAGEETDSIVLFSLMIVSAFQLFVWYTFTIILLTMFFNWWHKGHPTAEEKTTATRP